ncbi:CRISPR-associated endonuclease Cas2 [Candidatus Bathyarchaeota archaeon]|nr:CRISPR-associated endonuclease Cas2 [Candidatus Bathyarchaeota archaeon]
MYDIASSKLRRYVSSLLMDYGFIRIQESAMVADISSHLLKSLYGRLRSLKLGVNEDLMFLSLCRRCELAVYSVGRRPLPQKRWVVVY